MSNDKVRRDKEEISFKVQKCSNLRIKAKKIGIDVPSKVWILPNGIEQLQSLDEISYASDYDLVIKLFRKNNISYSLFEKNITTYPKLSQHSFEFVTLPIIAFTIELIKEHPEIITTALTSLNLFFKKRLHRDPQKQNYKIKSTVINEVRNSTFKKYEFEGPPERYKNFIDFVKTDKDD